MAKVFISYSHRDEDIKDQMVEHFSNLIRDKTIELWHDRHLLAGEEFTPEIMRQLCGSDIILLLVSSRFLSSDYCRNNELPLAMKLHNKGDATVIPILVSHCDWEATALYHLNALPKNGRPIKNFGNRDLAYNEITKKLRERVTVKSATPNFIKEVSAKPNNKVALFKGIFSWFLLVLGSLTLAVLGVAEAILASLFSGSKPRRKTKKAKNEERQSLVILFIIVGLILVVMAEINSTPDVPEQSNFPYLEDDEGTLSNSQ